MSDELVVVYLLGLPVDLHRRARDHQDTLRRELALVEASEPAAAGSRLISLSEEYRTRFSKFSEAPNSVIDEAAADALLDLAYEVPDEVADAAENLGALLDEIDDLCRAGELVTLVAPPDVRLYRRWFLDEFIHQIRGGREPIPWQEVELSGAAERQASDELQPTVAGDDDPNAGVDPIVVAGDLDLFGAPALRSAIIGRLDAGERWIVIDLSRCRFIDSVGLSLLLTTRERCQSAGGGLSVVGADEAALRLFETVGVRELLIR